MSSIFSLLAQALPSGAPAAPAGPWYHEPWFNVIIALAVLVAAVCGRPLVGQEVADGGIRAAVRNYFVLAHRRHHRLLARLAAAAWASI